MECVSDIELGKRGRAEGCGMKRGRKYVLFFIHVVIWPKSIHHSLRLQSGTHAAVFPEFFHAALVNDRFIQAVESVIRLFGEKDRAAIPARRAI